MALTVTLNGQEQAFAALSEGTALAALIHELGLKADRVAVEHNGEIARRASWDQVTLHTGDKLEVVHFVGGGSGVSAAPTPHRIYLLAAHESDSADV